MFLGLLESDKKKLEKKFIFLLASWKSLTKRAGYGARAGSVNQVHGSKNPDPDKVVTDPEHCSFNIPDPHWFPGRSRS
jgi:hypothetical protein